MRLAHSEYLKRIEGYDVLVRKDSPRKGKVALVSRDGSGHEPSNCGYVGKGMLNGVVAGEVFTSPTPEQIFQAIRAVDGGSGVLQLLRIIQET